MVRVTTVMVGLAIALPAIADEMNATEARQFVVGKLFTYNCFDGTRGMARVHDDGSVEGFIQVRGTGLTRHGTMPVGTLRADGGRVSRPFPAPLCSHAFISNVPMPPGSAARSWDWGSRIATSPFTQARRENNRRRMSNCQWLLTNKTSNGRIGNWVPDTLFTQMAPVRASHARLKAAIASSRVAA